jgi:hypothetical protein
VSEPLDKAAILDYLGELADELAPGPQQRVIIVVGGSLLALHDLRQSTRDVDSVARLDDELRAAADRVAARHGLERGRWLNDRAAMFRPATLSPQTCEVVLEHPRLLVLGAPLDDVFLMKLGARASDFDDLRALWPLCSFSSPDEAAQRWHEAYPHEEHDPYLADHIRTIAGEQPKLR